MTRANPMDATNNRTRQEKFADSLIACLGVEGAIRACRANVWDGVLGLVLRHKRCTREPLGGNQWSAAPAQQIIR